MAEPPLYPELRLPDDLVRDPSLPLSSLLLLR